MKNSILQSLFSEDEGRPGYITGAAALGSLGTAGGAEYLWWKGRKKGIGKKALDKMKKNRRILGATSLGLGAAAVGGEVIRRNRKNKDDQIQTKTEVRPEGS